MNECNGLLQYWLYFLLICDHQSFNFLVLCFMQGFQLLKNGKPYGSVIPPDVRSMRVKGLTLGDRVELQLITLTKQVPAASKTHKSNCSYLV